MTALTRREAVRLPLAAITLDPELQPRAAMDRATYEDYGHALAEGATLPPVLVVATEDGKHLLADGYHRWHAHKALGFDDIAAELHPGTRADALRLSLAANAEHGKRRDGLVSATDVEGVIALLRCTGRWAEVLTKEAREARRAELEAAVRTKLAEGKSIRQVAEELGASKSAVDRLSRLDVPEAKASQTGHAEAEPAEGEPEQDAPADRLRQAEDAANAGAEAYAAECRAVGEAPTLRGLRKAVREGLAEVLGPPPPRSRRPASPSVPPPVRRLDPSFAAWCDLTRGAELIAQAEPDTTSPPWRHSSASRRNATIY